MDEATEVYGAPLWSLNPGLYLSVEDESCVEDGAPYPLQNVGAGRLRGFRKCPVFVEDGPDDFP